MKIPFLKSQKSAIRETLSTLDLLREQIADAQGRIAAATEAPLSAAEATEALDAWLDRIATDAVDALRPGARFTSAEAAGVGLVLPIFSTRAGDAVTRDTARATEILLGLIVASSRTAIRAICVEQISDHLAARPGLSPDERAEKLGACGAELARLEAQEETVIRALEDAGTAVDRRDDASAEFLLATDAALDRAAA